MAEGKCTRFRFSLANRSHKQVVINNTVEATVIKFVVKREDLKQVLEAIRDGRKLTNLPPAESLEQRLNSMRRRQHVGVKSQLKGRSCSRGVWRPVLQSIPEEF